MASGRPVIAFRGGGVLDYMKEGLNGIFFNEQSYESLYQSINDFEMNQDMFDTYEIRNSIKQYNYRNFSKKFKKIVNSLG